MCPIETENTTIVSTEACGWLIGFWSGSDLLLNRLQAGFRVTKRDDESSLSRHSRAGSGGRHRFLFPFARVKADVLLLPF